MLVDLLHIGADMPPTEANPVLILFTGPYLDGELQVGQRKDDKQQILFHFESHDMEFSGGTTLNNNEDKVSMEEMKGLLHMIAAQYFSRVMYLKELSLKNGEYLH